MPSIPQPNSNTDDNSQSGKEKKRRRGLTEYNYLIRYINRLNNAISNNSLRRDYKWIATNFIKRRAEFQSQPANSLSAAVIVAALQRDVITVDEWENGLRYMRPQDKEWTRIIDTLFLKIVGRQPDRSTEYKLNLDALDAWDCVKLNCTEEQLQYLAHIKIEDTNEYSRPFSFDEMKAGNAPSTSKKPSTEKESDISKPSDLLNAFLLLLAAAYGGSRDPHEDERYGGRYGYGVRMPKKQPTQHEPINPEQIDHEDQVAVDRIAADLLADIDI